MFYIFRSSLDFIQRHLRVYRVFPLKRVLIFNEKIFCHSCYIVISCESISKLYQNVIYLIDKCYANFFKFYTFFFL